MAASSKKQTRHRTSPVLLLGGSSSTASDALTAVPSSPVVESCRDDRLLIAAALRLSKHEGAATLAPAPPDGPGAAVALSRRAWRSWPQQISSGSSSLSAEVLPSPWTVVEGNGTGAIHKLADLAAVEACLAEWESRMSPAEDQDPRSYTVHIELTMWDNFERDDADSPAVYTVLDVSIDQPDDPRDLLTVAALKAALEQFDGGSADEPIPF